MNGVIFTFYSYKGGVGRSMALANIAVQFHRQGYRTLLIDMDLEAPGLERYFAETEGFDTAGLQEKRGFCDFIQAYLERASTADAPGEPLYPPLDDYLVNIGGEPSNPLLFMHAGQRWGDAWPTYVQFIQNFEWSDFYERWEGGACLEWFAAELRTKAEIVLIDSRTGITERGGVATQHLADAVVVLFGSNLENVENSAKMALSFISGAVQSARGGRPLSVVAVPARVDDQDSRGFSEFQKRCAEAFSTVPCTPVDGHSMDEMCIPYLAPFSYRELILFGNQEIETSARRIIEAYSRIARNMQRLAPHGTALREGTPASRRASFRVALLAASPDEALAKALSSLLAQHGLECAIFATRSVQEKDLAPELSRMACAVALVTPALTESVVLRGVLQLLSDLGRPIIPAIFQAVESLPLLLADKASVDCTEGVPSSAAPLAEAIKGALAPSRREAPRAGSIYISYANADSWIASQIYDNLVSRGFSVWFDRERLAPGSAWQLEIERAMKETDVMLALVSPVSAESAGVRSEWTYYAALKKPIVPTLVGKMPSLPYVFSRTQAIDLTLAQPVDELGGGVVGFEQLAEAIRNRLERRQGEDPGLAARQAAPEQESRNPNQWLNLSPKPRPLSARQKWHVFLSYRSPQRVWVLSLYDILRQQGFEVFMDQLELRPGVSVIRTLQDALEKSQSAVLIWSHSSADSEWAMREWQTFELMTQTRSDFYFVPVTLDTSRLPAFARNRIFLDFSSDPDGPNGGELLRLLDAIAGKPLSAEAARFAAEQDAVAQQAANDIGAAIRNRDPELLLELFQAGGLPWRTSAALGCKAAEGLIKLGRNDDAIRMLTLIEEEFPRAVRPRQLTALSLARRRGQGDLRQAQRILGALYEGGERDAETLGIYGRTWMDRYERSGDVSDLRQSRDLYAEAFERAADDYYTGINAASKSALLGTPEDLERAAEYAAKVQKIVGTEPNPGDYWMTATVAETFLLMKRYSDSGRVYKAAIAMARSEQASHESTWKQACRLMAKLNPSPEERAFIRDVFAHLPDCQA